MPFSITDDKKIYKALVKFFILYDNTQQLPEIEYCDVSAVKTLLWNVGEGGGRRHPTYVWINHHERNLLLATLGDYQTNPTRLSGERLAATYKHLSFSADFKGLLIMTECLCLGRTQGGNLL